MNDFLRWLDSGRGKQSNPSQNLITYANPKFNKRKKSEDGGQFDWQGKILKDLPSSMGRTYADKFETLARQVGVRPEEMRDFKTFIDAQEYGAKTHSQHVLDYDIQQAKRQGEGARTILREREQRERQAEQERLAEIARQQATQKRVQSWQGLQGLGAGSQGGKVNMPETKLPSGVDKLLQDLQKAFTGENYRIEPDEKRKQQLEPSENLTHIGDLLPDGVERFAGRALSSATLGMLEQSEKRNLKDTPDEERQIIFDRIFGETDSKGQKVADVIADLTGYLSPGVAGVQGARLLGVGAKGLTKNISKHNLKELAKEGTIVGGALGATEVGVREALNPEDYSALDNLLHVGINATAGAVLDPLIGLAGPLAKFISEKAAEGALSKTVLKQLDDAVRSGDYESISSFLTRESGMKHGPLAETNVDLTPSKFSDGSVPEPLARPDVLEDLLSKGIEEPEPLSDDFINQLIEQRQQRTSATIAEEPSFQQKVEENFPEREVEVPRTVKEMDEFTPVNSETTARTKEPHEAVGRTFRRQWDSDANDLKQAEKLIVANDTKNILNVDGIGGITESDSVYKGFRGLQRTVAKAVHSARKSFDPIVKELKKANLSKKEFDQYASAMHYRDIYDNNMELVARRGEILDRLEHLENVEGVDADKEIAALVKEMYELNEYILPKGTTEDWVNYTIQKWQDNPTMAKLQEKLVKEQQKDLYMALRSEMYTDAQIQAMMERHPNYISMRRSIPELDEAVGAGSSRSTARKFIQARKNGSELETLSPLDSAYRNRVLAYTNAERAEVINRIGKYIEVEGAEQFFRQVPEANKNTLTGYKDGKPVYYEVPDFMINLYKNVDNVAEGGIPKFLRGLATLRKKTTTNLNPAFQFLSAVRDPIQMLAHSKTGAHLGDTVLGYLDSFMGKNLEKLSGGMFKSYRDVYNTFGNERSTFIGLDKNGMKEFTKALEKGKLSDGSVVLNPFKHLHDGLEGFGMRLEHGPRLGEMRSAKRKGLSDADAAFEAADIMDYLDMGAIVRKLNPYIPYLNPTIRGNIRTFQVLKNNPQRFFGVGFTYVTLPTLANYAMRYADTTNDVQRDKINNLQPWQKNLMWAIPVPNSDKIALMPKPFIFGQIFGNSVERTLDKVFEKSDKSAGKLMQEQLTDMVSVLSVPYDVAGLMTGLEVMANKDFFTDMPIESQAMQREEDKTQRYDAYTSEAAKGLGKLTKQSPAQIDHILKKTLGTMGRDALDASDNILSSLIDDVPAKLNETKDILDPFKRFKHRDTQSSGVYEDLRKQALRDDKEWAKHRDMLKDMGIKSPTKQETPAQVMKAEWDEINKEIREITNDTKMSAKEKKRLVTALRNKQRRLGSQFLEN